MSVTGKYGAVYRYQVYRHPITDGRKRRHGHKVDKCTVKIKEETAA
jgi:hypothetical protein